MGAWERDRFLDAVSLERIQFLFPVFFSFFSTHTSTSFLSFLYSIDPESAALINLSLP